MKYVRYEDGTVGSYNEQVHVVDGMQTFECEPEHIPSSGQIPDLQAFLDSLSSPAKGRSRKSEQP